MKRERNSRQSKIQEMNITKSKPTSRDREGIIKQKRRLNDLQYACPIVPALVIHMSKILYNSSFQEYSRTS